MDLLLNFWRKYSEPYLNIFESKILKVPWSSLVRTHLGVDFLKSNGWSTCWSSNIINDLEQSSPKKIFEDTLKILWDIPWSKCWSLVKTKLGQDIGAALWSFLEKNWYTSWSGFGVAYWRFLKTMMHWCHHEVTWRNCLGTMKSNGDTF